MTAWLLLVTAGINLFTISGIATQADCDTLAASLQQATAVVLAHSCISYEAASTVAEVHIFGPGNVPKAAGEAPSFQFKPRDGKAKPLAR